MRHRTTRAATLALCIAVLPAGPALAGPTGHGPSTTTDPYVLPSAAGVSVKSILTVDDSGAASNGYEFTGIPDGLGATRKGNKVSVQINHELTPTDGVPRAHGQPGSFVSTWSIDRSTLSADSGADFIKPGVQFWDYASQTYGLAASAGGPNPRLAGDIFPAQSSIFARFCSATLSASGQFLGDRGRRGYDGQIYFANEENGDEGRTFGVLRMAREQLPRLGLFSWENTWLRTTPEHDARHGHGGRRERRSLGLRRPQVAKGDATPGGPAQRDRLRHRRWRPPGDRRAQFRAAYGRERLPTSSCPSSIGTRPGAPECRGGDRWPVAQSDRGRAWDPSNPNDYYFVTTAGRREAGSSPPRDGGGLWRLSFDDIENPRSAATLTLLLDGTESTGSCSTARQHRRRPARSTC